MSLEEQLRELLEKLDLTCAMKSSGSRSKRAKLLKKEISSIRNKISQQHNQVPQIESGIGSFEEESAALEQDGEEEGKIYTLFKLVLLWTSSISCSNHVN